MISKNRHAHGRTAAAAVLGSLLLVLDVTTLGAVSSQTWRQRELADFENAQLHGVSLSADGTIRLAPPLDLLYEADEPYIWALAEGADGAIYAAGGNDGAIYRIAPSGEGEVYFHVEEPQVQAMVVGPDGDLFVGTAPGGRIYKISPDGGQAWVHETGEEYVWALLFDRAGNLFAGTGDEGRVLRIDRSGNGEVFFDSAETHIRTLALDADGNLLAGTAGHGLVFRIAADGQGFVLYDAPLDEVAALVSAGDGKVYVAVLGESRPPVQSGRGRAPAPTPAAAPVIPENGPHGTPRDEASAPQTGRQEPNPQAERRVRVSMNGKVLAISPDGFGREVWSGDQEAMLSLALDGHGGLLMGSSVDGRIYALDAAGTVSEIGRSPSAQVTVLQPRAPSAPSGGGRRGVKRGRRAGTAAAAEILVAGSNHGTVSVLRPGHAPEGSIVSQALDARSFATWGRATWRADQPSGTAVRIQARSGNTENPDRTWSDWGPALSDPRTARLSRPAARFLQWRAVLTTDDTARTPVLHEVAVTYLQRNLPPEIDKVVVHPPGLAFQSVPGRPSGRAQDGRETGPSEAGAAAGRRSQTQPRRGFEPGARSISWRAVDANADLLLYEVSYRSVDEASWKPLRSRIEEGFVTLDTTSMPDGTYVVRIVASDAATNPPGLALTAEAVSEQFDVDNTPPRIERVRARTEAPIVRLSFSVSDTFSIVREAAYAVNAGDWVTASPEDGLSDDLVETYDLEVAGLPPGEHSIVVRAVDAAGNVGAGKAIVEVP